MNSKDSRSWGSSNRVVSVLFVTRMEEEDTSLRFAKWVTTTNDF